MKTTYEYVQSYRVFDDLQILADRIFVRANRLPDKVFRPQIRHFSFVDFDRLFEPEFWNLIAELARLASLSEIVVSTQDPDPRRAFYTKFSFFNTFKIDAAASSRAYSEAVRYAPKGADFDSIHMIADTVLWLGASPDWGVFGQREFGLGIVGTARPIPSGPLIENWTQSVSEALSDFCANNFPHQKIPAEFESSMVRNYSPP